MSHTRNTSFPRTVSAAREHRALLFQRSDMLKISVRGYIHAHRSRENIYPFIK